MGGDDTTNRKGCSGLRKNVIWGYAGIYPGAFGIWEGDVTANRLRFAARHGFASTHIALEELEDPARRELIGNLVAEHGLRLTPHLDGVDYFGDDLAGAERAIDRFVASLAANKELLRAPIAATCVGPYHRFMQHPPLERQMERLARLLAPAARACRELGVPLAIENHGDYYGSDLAALCAEVPGLGILLDTGNAYLVGERPVDAARAAAPYTVGMHLKDHLVHPDPHTLTFVLKGASLGDGHAGLAEIYDIVMEYAAADTLVIQWELIPPDGMDPFESLERSRSFIRTLQGGERL